MYKDILSENQLEILPFLSKIDKRFYLVGGTAIALYIGHRGSIDYDLFTDKSFSTSRIYDKLNSQDKFKVRMIWNDKEQLHCELNNVKVTFYPYPYKIPLENKFEDYFRMPSLLTLAAMKALALGGRAKWKDYVDMYFLLKHHFSLKEISEAASNLFGEGVFNLKLLREQLSYYKDVDYAEKVYFKKGSEVTDSEIKNYLIDVSTEPFK